MAYRDDPVAAERAASAPGEEELNRSVEASRVRTESARLVRTIGTRPQDDAGALRAGQVRELLGQHVAGLEVRHHQDVRLPGHGGDDLLRLGRLQTDGVVEGQRAVKDA